MQKLLSFCIALSFILLLCLTGYSQTADLKMAKYGSVPLSFCENNGQVDNKIMYSASGSGTDIYFAPEGATFILRKKNKLSKNAFSRYPVDELLPSMSDPPVTQERLYESYAVKLNFLNSNNDIEVIGEERLPWRNNYFIGNDPSLWRTNIPNFRKIRYSEIYQGIDLVYYGSQTNIKYDYIVYPGEDPDQILLQYDIGKGETNNLSVNSGGELIIRTPFGDIKEKKPYAYQVINGKEKEVEIDYKIVDLKANIYTFKIGRYDPRFTLTIDPELVYSTIIGGNGTYEEPYSIYVDNSGCVYLTGITSSLDFPVTSGAIQASRNDNEDIFVCKLNQWGTGLVYSSYIGGNSHENGVGITSDISGNIYVSGHTLSTDWPVTQGTHSNSNKGLYDIFVTRLDSSGSTILSSTYIGGDENDTGGRIFIDNQGDIIIYGNTKSTNFPTSSTAYDRSHNGHTDFFILRMDPDLHYVNQSTLFGGRYSDYLMSCKSDSEGNFYLTGYTTSGDFPTTNSVFDNRQITRNCEGFVCKMNSTFRYLDFSTYVGGDSYDYFFDLELDEDNNIYLAGYSESSDFPTTPGAYSEENSGLYDAILCKMDSQGLNLIYSTYFGGSGIDHIKSLCIDSEDNLIIGGHSESSDLPTTENAFQNAPNGNLDLFITKFNSSCDSIIYSSYFGGSDDEIVQVMSIDKYDFIYAAGYTYSTYFPTTPGAFSSDCFGEDVFVMKLTFDPLYNYPPFFDPVPDQILEIGDTLKIVLNAIDRDRDNLTFSTENNPPGSNLSDNVFTWIPVSGQKGNHKVKFIVSDGLIADTIEVNIFINTPPVLQPVGDICIYAKDTLRFVLKAIDLDRDSLSFFMECGFSGPILTDSVFIWIPESYINGDFSFLFIVSDGINSDSITITITVIINLKPVLYFLNDQSTYVNDTLKVILKAVSRTLNRLTYSAVNIPQGAVFSDSIFTWKPEDNQTGIYIVKFIAKDSIFADSQSVRITVLENAPPKFSPANPVNITVYEGDSVRFYLEAIDNNNSNLSFSMAGFPDGSLLNGQVFSWLPGEYQTGSYTISFSATDGQLSAYHKVTIIVKSSYFELLQNYPNPFNPETKISFRIPNASDVKIRIFNIKGQLVATLVNTVLPVGKYTYYWDGKNSAGRKVGTGTYIYQLIAGNFIASKKMTIIK